MDQDVENNSDFFICVGCLTGNRKLKTVVDTECLQYLHSFVDASSIPDPLTLCWECSARLQNSVKFKKQVKMGFDQFAMFMINQNMKTIATLSHLKKSAITDYNYTFTEDPGWEISSKMVPQNFVKLEEVKMEDFHDDFYTDDKFDEKPSLVEVSISKVDNFSDSDDEPLSSKKSEKKKRHRKEKSKKEKKRKRGKEEICGVIDNARTRNKLKQLNVEEGRVEMVLLSWDEVHLERETLIQSASFSSLRHRCGSCAVGFSHRDKYDTHLANKHDQSSGGLVCEFCQVVCKDEKALSAHRRRHRVRWRCTECGALYSRAAVCADHAARAHGAGDAHTHACPHCAHRASSLSRLRQHLKSHLPRAPCPLCDKTFPGRAALNTHLFIHKGEKEHACPKCDKKFLFKRTMQVHLLTHNVDQSFYCRECDMTFRNKMSFYQHKRYSLRHIDPARLKYTCELCGKSFAQALRLKEHNIAVHLKSTPVKCTQEGCTFACATAAALRTHVRMVHRGARRARNHVCHLCGKAYGSKSLLTGHLNGHTGARPLRCGSCDAAFTYEAALYNHTRLVHSKKKSTIKSAQPTWPPVPAQEKEQFTLT